ncbi:MAG: hypothetical protein U1F57_04805 [bacterium]
MNTQVNVIQNIQSKEGISEVVCDPRHLGQRVVLKNTLFTEPAPEAPAVEPKKAVFMAQATSSSGLFGASKADQLKQMLERKRAN